jgi:signal transduction histidine kinase
MTLRARLLVLMLSMVAMVALTLIALNLDSLAVASLDFAISSSDFAGQAVHSSIIRLLSDSPPTPFTLAETKRFWSEEVTQDLNLANLLERTMAQSRSIVEINVVGEDGSIVASSNPQRLGSPAVPKQDLHTLRTANPFTRMKAMLNSAEDYDMPGLPLGISGQQKPLFTIQVLVSPILWRDRLEEEMKTDAKVSGMAMILAFVLAYWSTNLALRPLARISHLIDDITSGNPPVLTGIKTDPARELAIIESKLSLLGARYRDARLDASQLRTNLEDVLEKLDAGTREHIEHQIALAQRLTAINSLTGRVAHEIKNPLNSIALRLEMLRNRVSEDSPDSEAEFAILTEEITRLDRVVRTFLDFNRPVQLVLEEVNVGESAADILNLLEPEATQKGIQISFDNPREPVIVRADPDLLRQAMLNIAVNGLEAMEGGGELAIGIERNRETCSIRIQDTGPGIPASLRDKIFQLYYTTKPKGSGIGLAMTFRAVQLHGGTINVEGDNGKGTTFRITLPLAGVK